VDAGQAQYGWERPWRPVSVLASAVKLFVGGQVATSSWAPCRSGCSSGSDALPSQNKALVDQAQAAMRPGDEATAETWRTWSRRRPGERTPSNPGEGLLFPNPARAELARDAAGEPALPENPALEAMSRLVSKACPGPGRESSPGRWGARQRPGQPAPAVTPFAVAAYDDEAAHEG
jgi:hypothetical protein